MVRRFALSISIPVTLVMGGVLFLFANDNIKTGGSEPSSDKHSNGNGHEP